MATIQRREFLRLIGWGAAGAALALPPRPCSGQAPLGKSADAVSPSVGKGSATQPNILFILCDDLGINDLHCYGRQDHHTPNLDQFATQGMRFTSAYCAQPICSPSRAAILTGKNPARLHLTTFLPGRPDCPAQKVLQPEIEMQVPLTEKMLPRYFKAAGYVCGAFGKWHVGGKGFGPLDHGFDSYHPGHPVTTPSATEGGKGEYDLTAAAEQFMVENQQRPFLVYLAHNTPHIPYAAQAARVAHNTGAFEPVYAGVIETLDDTVGRLLAKLEALKLTEKTIVIFTSDNGGLHVPEGPHPRVTHNTPFRAGKGYVYEGGLRVPLIVRWPGRVPAGKVVAEPVINTDWIPTLLELAGLPAPAGLDGVSLAPGLLGRAGMPQRSFFWHFPHYTNQGSRPSGAMRDGDWLMVEFYDAEQAELYNLRTDCGEKQDLAAQQSERVAKMRAALAAWRVANHAQSNTPNPAYVPEQYRQLYEDVDASRFEPATADEAGWQRIWQWRKNMNAAVRSVRAEK
jgi:arylsulfatase A-like enzyme